MTLPYGMIIKLLDKLKLAQQVRYRAGQGSSDAHRTGHVLSPRTARQAEICLFLIFFIVFAAGVMYNNGKIFLHKKEETT